MPISLVLADPYPLILDGMEKAFSLETDFQVVARCTNGEEGLKAVSRLNPDILVCDIHMPRKNGLEITRELRQQNLPTRIVLLTSEINDHQLLEAVRLSIQGIVLKEMPSHLLIQCIRKVYAGGQWIERTSTRLALENLMRREVGYRELAGLLTPKEFEIMRLVTKGLRNKEIAEQLFITQGTVKSHVHSIYDKIKVTSRMGLMRYAHEKGLA